MKYLILLFALFSYSAFSQVCTEGVYRVKNLSAVIAETFPDRTKAEAKAKELSLKCFCQANVIQPDIVCKTAKTVSSSSLKSSSVSSKAVSSSASVKVGQLIPVSAVALSAKGENAPKNSIDGDETTRWESVWQIDPQYIKFDLGVKNPITKIQIHWEDSNAEDYIVQGSVDDSTYVTLIEKTGMEFGERTDILSVSGAYRFIKITGTKRPADDQWGYSIYEVKIYNDSPMQSSSAAPSSISSSSLSSRASSSSSSAPIATLDLVKFTCPNQFEDGSPLAEDLIKEYELIRKNRTEKIKSLGCNIEYLTNPKESDETFYLRTVSYDDLVLKTGTRYSSIVVAAE